MEVWKEIKEHTFKPKNRIVKREISNFGNIRNRFKKMGIVINHQI